MADSMISPSDYVNRSPKWCSRTHEHSNFKALPNPLQGKRRNSRYSLSRFRAETSKCTNPKCSVNFRYFDESTLFHIDMRDFGRPNATCEFCGYCFQRVLGSTDWTLVPPFKAVQLTKRRK